MEVNMLSTLAIFLSMSVVVSRATSPPEVYWKKMLPNAAIPKAVKILLHEPAESINNKEKIENITKGEVHNNIGDPFDPYDYNYAASKTQLYDDPSLALFFLEKDMKPGQQMTVSFTQSTTKAVTFLPRQEAESIPFSTNKMSMILHKFSIKPGSREAQVMEDTIKRCDRKGIREEEKFCATSLESMIDYAISNLGNHAKALSTEVENNKSRNYTISEIRKVAAGDGEAIACHKQDYAYAVFYCHKSKGTLGYIVSLTSSNGSKAKATAICHKDTRGWNPKHLAFQILKVKPGNAPICHFLPENHIIWVHS